MNAAVSPLEGLGEESALDQTLRRARFMLSRRMRWLESRGMGGRDLIDLSMAGLDEPVDEYEWYAQRANEADATENWREPTRPKTGRVAFVADTFRLSSVERDCLELCLCVAMDPALAPVLARVDASRRPFVTEALMGRLYGWGRGFRLTPELPLREWQLVSLSSGPRGEPAALNIDPAVLAWICGGSALDELLSRCTNVAAARPPLARWPVGEAAESVRAASRMGTALRHIISGPVGVGRRTFAACVAHELGLETLAIDCDRISDADWHDTFRRAQRYAALNTVALVWHGQKTQRAWPLDIPAAPVQFVATEDGREIGRVSRCVDRHIDLEPATLDEQERILLEGLPQSQSWDPVARKRLLSHHKPTVGELKEIVLAAPSDAETAAAECRRLGKGRLGELALELPTTFVWSDLVVPDALGNTLRQFAFEAEERTAVWEQAAPRRLYPRGTALVALLAGTPGTGKTMAAQVIARELGVSIYRVDLATIVSKYIGETAKNLKTVFARAGRLSSVLLFDEADALFSKRTDVKDSHDRHANADTNYLLQLLEEYRGVALLATNKRGNVDPAFVRRIRYVLDFPKPDAPARLQIWRNTLGELWGSESLKQLDATLSILATHVELSGAEIKNALLSALFFARRHRVGVGTTHLVAGVEHEISKEGKRLGRSLRHSLTAQMRAKNV